jgi:hypothetical protein
MKFISSTSKLTASKVILSFRCHLLLHCETNCSGGDSALNDEPGQISTLTGRMQASIQAFHEGLLTIDRLAWELKSAIAALRGVADESWVDELKAIWNQLEVINAFFIESGREALSAEERKEAAEVLEELRTAIIVY